MKRNIFFLLLIAGAAVLIGVARKPAPPAPSLSATSSRAERQPKQPTKPVARQLANAAVEAAAASQNRDRQVALEIESALMSKDAGRRETAFAVLLPELLRTEPARVVDMVARQPAGEPRETLRDEVARQWITRDTESAVAWL
ncbi:MAG: hypothetical protein H7Y89_12475, partial [Steroidobacteraceae bacterium]|nr:hypothetical protein [Steroidobacteraceae bacterium]